MIASGDNAAGRRVVIVGAGAAGAMAAIFAASVGASTRLVERTREGGRKILISGGGRCNILPAHVDESRFVSDSPSHLVRRIIRSWPLHEQIRFFEREAGIPLVEETESAKLFPVSNRARDVRDRLLALAERRGATLVMNAAVTGVDVAASGWRVEIAGAAPLEADAVIVATGGLSVPSTGSDGAGLRFAERLGHTIHPPYPALTPIVSEPAPFAPLAGVSLPVTITARAREWKAVATGGFVFTHRGYSGPAVLDVSHVAVRSLQRGERADLRVRWTPLGDAEWNAALRPQGARSVLAAVRAALPDRLAAMLLETSGLDASRTLSNLRRDERQRLIDTLVRFALPWTGDDGYKKAEVTGGGVSLSEVDSRTMESRRRRGLYLCGEMLDAFGPIGGHNFLWAWVTGRAAGLAAARSTPYP